MKSRCGKIEDNLLAFPVDCGVGMEYIEDREGRNESEVYFGGLSSL